MGKDVAEKGKKGPPFVALRAERSSAGGSLVRAVSVTESNPRFFARLGQPVSPPKFILVPPWRPCMSFELLNCLFALDSTGTAGCRKDLCDAKINPFTAADF